MRRTLSKIRTFLFFLSALDYNLVRIRALGLVKKKKTAPRKKYGRSCLEKVYVRINCRRLKML